MKSYTPFLSQHEIEFYDEEISKNQFKSKYNFLKAHNGFRKGNTHVFLGTSGGGKSTLIRSLVVDVLQNIQDQEDNVLVWLSEEKSKDFIRELHKAGMPYSFIKKIRVYSEADSTKETKDICRTLEYIIDEVKPMAVVFDNLTTSIPYATARVADQDRIFKGMKNLAQDKNIPFLLVAHTNAGIGENYEAIIDQNDIRGSKMPVMLAEYFYILQSFYSKANINGEEREVRINTVRITKFRGNPVEHRLFALNYSKELRLFESDRRLNFLEFKEAFKSRNKLK